MVFFLSLGTQSKYDAICVESTTCCETAKLTKPAFVDMVRGVRYAFEFPWASFFVYGLILRGMDTTGNG
jgi:hypothetical protein